jgi:sulfonate transport system permease protein
VIALLVAWELVAYRSPVDAGTHRHTIPTIQDVVSAFKLLGYYWKGGFGVKATSEGGPLTYDGAILSLIYNTFVTSERLVVGFCLGVAAGLAVAIGISWSTVLRGMFAAPAHVARMLPLLAMVPLFQLWFGLSAEGVIVFVAFSVAVIIFAVALNAIENVPEFYMQFASSLGASATRRYLTVLLPASFPQIRTGLLLALGFAWSGTIAGEFLGPTYGLGRVVLNADYFGRTNLMMLVGLVVVGYAALSYALASHLLRWLTRWAD